MAGLGLGKQPKLGDLMKIRGKYYYIMKSEFFGIYGFVVVLPLIIQYVNLSSDIPILLFIKLSLLKPMNWIVLIFITWFAIKNFIHEYEPNEKKQ